MEKRTSLFRAVTRPLSLLLFWQSLGWISFGILEPSLSQKTGSPSDPALVFIVSITMTVLTAALGGVTLFHWKSTTQKDFQPRPKVRHKCRNCGYTISVGTSTCPQCGASTLF